MVFTLRITTQQLVMQGGARIWRDVVADSITSKRVVITLRILKGLDVPLLDQMDGCD